MSQYLLDSLQLQEVIVTTTSNHTLASGEHIDQRSGVAIESVQAQQHGSSGKSKLCGIVGDHRDGPQQFPTIIPIAWSTKAAQKLMRMRLEHDGAGAHHF